MRKVWLVPVVAALLLAACYRSHPDPEQLPTNVLVVLDRSGSMAESWDHRSKWVAANDALLGAIEAEDKELRVGMLLFPEPGRGHCAVAEPAGGVALEPAADFVARWRARPESSPGGDTPMEAAFRTVDATIDRAAAEGRLDERFVVLLLTDGQPNCSTDVSVLQELAGRWRRLGVEVHGIGLPGSEAAAELLDSISSTTTTVEDRGAPSTSPTEPGGEPSHRDPEDPDELEDDVGALI